MKNKPDTAIQNTALVQFTEKAISSSGDKGEAFTFVCPNCGGTAIGKKSPFRDTIQAYCPRCGLQAKAG